MIFNWRPDVFEELQSDTAVKQSRPFNRDGFHPIRYFMDFEFVESVVCLW